MGAFGRYSLVALATAVALQVLPGLLPPGAAPPLGGRVAKGWEEVEKAFRELHTSGAEREGSALAVYHEGELVVDLWGGWVDAAAARPWQEDSRAILFSSTKGLVALSAAVLVERGLLDYDAPVARYWPAFAQMGKRKITVSQLLRHEAGLAALDVEMTREMFAVGGDFVALEAALAGQEPNWAPAPKTHGYHGVTIGPLVDALVRKVTNGTSLAAFLRREMLEPQKLELSIGTPKEDFHRVARYVHPSLGAILADMLSNGKEGLRLPWNVLQSAWKGEKSLFQRALAENPPWLCPGGMATMYKPEVLALELASVGGVGTARALAAVFAQLERGRLLKRDGKAWQRIFKVVAKAERTADLVSGLECAWNEGFWAGDGAATLGHPEAGHPGYGGQVVKAVPGLGLSVAYVTNALVPQLHDQVPNFARLQKAVVARAQALKTK